MKKTVAILLLTVLLTAATACKKSDTIEVPVETTALSTEAGIPDDTLLISPDYDIDFSEYLTVPELSTIKISSAEFNKAWNSQADAIRSHYATYRAASATDAAALYDNLVISYKGSPLSADITLSESTRALLTVDQYNMVLGTSSLPGAYNSPSAPEKNNHSFDDQLVGAKIGQSGTVTVTYPDNYSIVELRGVVIKFDVTINSLQKATLPALSDAMVNEYTGGDYTTVYALMTQIKGNTAIDAIVKATTIQKYPETALNKVIDQYIDEYIAATYDIELSDAQIEEIRSKQHDNALAAAQERVAERMVLEYLFDKLDITLTQAEYIEKRDADYAQKKFYYLYYYDISSVEALESAMGKDNMVAWWFKHEKLLPSLIDAVVFE